MLIQVLYGLRQFGSPDFGARLQRWEVAREEPFDDGIGGGRHLVVRVQADSGATIHAMGDVRSRGRKEQRKGVEE